LNNFPSIELLTVTNLKLSGLTFIMKLQFLK